MIYSCAEHAGEALEETLEDGGLPPEIEHIASLEAPSFPYCFLCTRRAVYAVKSGSNGDGAQK